MNDDRLRKALDGNEDYDDAREDSLWSMASQFYSRTMRSVAVLTWSVGLVFIALAVFSGIAFFQTDEVRYQIMHAALFICAVQMIGLMKIFAWQMIHRNRVIRGMRRLEARLAAHGDDQTT